MRCVTVSPVSVQTQIMSPFLSEHGNYIEKLQKKLRSLYLD